MKERYGTGFQKLRHNIKYKLHSLYIKVFPARKKTGERHFKAKTKMAIFAWSVLSVQVIMFALFYVYVNIGAIFMGFQDSVTGSFTLNHFKYVINELLLSDGVIFIALRNTFLFFITGLVLMPINIIISAVLYKKLLGYKVFQIIFFLPSIIGAMVWMATYKAFIAPFGPLVELMQQLGLIKGAAPQFLEDSRYAIHACLAATVWLGLPSGMLLYGGSLARIPKEVIEAGYLDGLTFWKEIYYILVPLIWPLLSTNIIFAFIGFFSSSGNILLLTGGAYKTTTLSYFLFDQVIFGNKYNVPSALGLLITIASLPIALLGHKIAKSIETVEY